MTIKTIDYEDLSLSAKRRIDNAYEDAGIPVAWKSGRGHNIDFIPSNLWNLFIAQNKCAIERGDVKRIVFPLDNI